MGRVFNELLELSVLEAEPDCEPVMAPDWLLVRSAVPVLGSVIGVLASALALEELLRTEVLPLVEPEPLNEPEPLRLPEAFCDPVALDAPLEAEGDCVAPLLALDDGSVIEVDDEVSEPAVVVFEVGLDEEVPELVLAAGWEEVADDELDCACSASVAAKSAAVPEPTNLRVTFIYG